MSQSHSTALLRLRVIPAAESSIRSGHPWVFSESIREQNRTGRAGELAVIYDRRNRFLALGLFDPDSPIRVRILQTGERKPIDRDWWAARLEAALKRRGGLFDGDTTGYRCVHGESDGWPGLVLDRYADTLALKCYTIAWMPRLDETVSLINELLPNERIVLRLSRNIGDAARANFGRVDGRVISGVPLTEPVIFKESGLRFEADVLRGQKTGFFLDQRENRRLVESFAAGRDVLNAFSFSGGFSLYAARGGARSVTDIDISAHALAASQRNFERNRAHARVRACKHRVLQADAFEWLQDGPAGKFDLIILDPPSLAKRASERLPALRAYAHLAGSAIQLLERNGMLVAASCSAHVSAEEFFETVRTAAHRSGRSWTELRTSRHPADHPATFKESEYLKCIYLRFEM